MLMKKIGIAAGLVLIVCLTVFSAKVLYLHRDISPDDVGLVFERPIVFNDEIACDLRNYKGADGEGLYFADYFAYQAFDALQIAQGERALRYKVGEMGFLKRVRVILSGLSKHELSEVREKANLAKWPEAIDFLVIWGGCLKNGRA